MFVCACGVWRLGPKVADTNFQKFLGCIPDTIGVLMQAQALSLFKAGCYDEMPREDELGNRISYTVGAGYWSYVFCCLAAVVRVAMHYLTPVPGGGAGCDCVDLLEELEDARGASFELLGAALGPELVGTKKKALRPALQPRGLSKKGGMKLLNYFGVGIVFRLCVIAYQLQKWLIRICFLCARLHSTA